jgi:hypothetical protein
MSNTAHLTLLAADHRVRLAVVTRPPDSLDYTPPIAWCVLNPVTQMKVSTGRPNPNARDPSVGVIILYCGFEDDEAETKAVGRTILQKMKYTGMQGCWKGAAMLCAILQEPCSVVCGRRRNQCAGHSCTIWALLTTHKSGLASATTQRCSAP